MSLLARISFVILAVLVVVVLVRPAISDFLVPDATDSPTFTRSAVEQARLITCEDARYHRLLGAISHGGSDSDGLTEAVRFYQKSLERNPVDAFTWLRLMRAAQQAGLDDLSHFAARRAVLTDSHNPVIVWEAGVFLLTEDQLAESTKLLRRYLMMKPQDQERVYALFFTMGTEPRFILDSLVPPEYEYYRRYLRFLSQNRVFGETSEVWQRLARFDLARQDYLDYCDALIGAGEIEKAKGVWKAFLEKYNILGSRQVAQDMLWNPDFELPVQNGGFDWRIGKAEGVRVFVDQDVRMSGTASLSAIFDGTGNPDILLAHQIVPLAGGHTYRMSGYIKTEKVTTKNGIFLEASGLKCAPFYVHSESVTGTSNWQKIEVEFTTPPDCVTVRIGIRRAKSDRLDNRIGGDAWVDLVSLRQVEKKSAEARPAKRH